MSATASSSKCLRRSSLNPAASSRSRVFCARVCLTGRLKRGAGSAAPLGGVGGGLVGRRGVFRAGVRLGGRLTGGGGWAASLDGIDVDFMRPHVSGSPAVTHGP